MKKWALNSIDILNCESILYQLLNIDDISILGYSMTAIVVFA
jgi:hypothetical protein